MDDLAPRDQRAVGIDVEQFAGGAVELDHAAFAKCEQVGERHRRRPDLDRDAQRYAASSSKFGATAIFLLSRRSRAAFGASLMSLIVGSSFNTVDQDGRVAVGLADAAGREIAAGDGYRNMTRYG